MSYMSDSFTRHELNNSCVCHELNVSSLCHHHIFITSACGEILQCVLHWDAAIYVFMLWNGATYSSSGSCSCFCNQSNCSYKQMLQYTNPTIKYCNMLFTYDIDSFHIYRKNNIFTKNFKHSDTAIHFSWKIRILTGSNRHQNIYMHTCMHVSLSCARARTRSLSLALSPGTFAILPATTKQILSLARSLCVYLCHITSTHEANFVADVVFRLRRRRKESVVTIYIYIYIYKYKKYRLIYAFVLDAKSACHLSWLGHLIHTEIAQPKKRLINYESDSEMPQIEIYIKDLRGDRQHNALLRISNGHGWYIFALYKYHICTVQMHISIEHYCNNALFANITAICTHVYVRIHSVYYGYLYMTKHVYVRIHSVYVCAK